MSLMLYYHVFDFVCLITWHITQHLHGRRELLTSLLMLAVLVKQTACVVDVVRVVLRQLLQQGLHTHKHTHLFHSTLYSCFL